MAARWQLEEGKRGSTMFVYYNPERCDWGDCIERAVAESGIDRRLVTVIAMPQGSTWSCE